MKTYYQFLGIDPEATPEEIKAAALLKAKKFHPSKYPGNAKVAERFNNIKKVYNILANPKKRAAYDAILAKQLTKNSYPPAVHNKTGPTADKPVRKKRPMSGTTSEAASAKAVSKNAHFIAKKVPKSSARFQKTKVPSLPNNGAADGRPPVEVISNETQAVDKIDKINKPHRNTYWFLNLTAAFLFIGIGAYFLLVDPAVLMKYLAQKELLSDKLPYITLSSWIIFGLGVLILLHTLWAALTMKNNQVKSDSDTAEQQLAQKTAPVTTKKPPTTLSQERKEPNQKQTPTTAAAGESAALSKAVNQPKPGAREAVKKKAPATIPQPQKVPAHSSKPIEKASSPNPIRANSQKQTDENQLPDESGRTAKIHWFRYLIAGIFIATGAYFLWVKPTWLKEYLNQAGWAENPLTYITAAAWIIFGLGILILLSGLIQTVFTLFRKRQSLIDGDQSVNLEYPTADTEKSEKGDESPSATNNLEKGNKPGQKRPLIRWVSEKILYRADIHGFGYIMGFLLIGISVYLLLFDSEGLKKYLQGIEFLQNKWFLVTLSLQIFLGLGILVLLQTSFQQFTVTLMITSERTIARFGLFFKQQIEIRHAQFEHIEVKQSLLGKILGFGTVKIRGTRGSKGVGGIKIQVSNVSSAKQFEKRLRRIIKHTQYHKI